MYRVVPKRTHAWHLLASFIAWSSMADDTFVDQMSNSRPYDSPSNYRIPPSAVSVYFIPPVAVLPSSTIHTPAPISHRLIPDMLSFLFRSGMDMGIWCKVYEFWQWKKHNSLYLKDLWSMWEHDVLSPGCQCRCMRAL